jgi:hypothetical protein
MDMKSHTNSTSAFSTKKYIKKTWLGLVEFFEKYNGGLGQVKTKIPVTDAEILAIRASTTALDKTNQAIDEVKAILGNLEVLRVTIITQKSTDPVAVPSLVYLNDLLGSISGKPGGLLWQEDTLTDRILRSGKCTDQDKETLGIVYHPTPVADLDHHLAEIYAKFDGGKVPIHWTLPFGWHTARLSRSINHGEWEHLVTTDEASYIDRTPVPAQAKVYAYKLEIMDGDTPIGKPVIDKIIVGQDISVEETQL